jgi:hypothetical protein
VPVGAKSWLVCYADVDDVAALLRSSPALDRDATDRLVRAVHPGSTVTLDGEDSLESADPPDGVVVAAVWPGAAVLCSGEVAIDRPSEIHPRFTYPGLGRRVVTQAMHSVVDWAAFSVRGPDGALLRSLSVSPDDGVIEDLGERLTFEAPYWAGERPLDDEVDDEVDDEDDEDPYPLPFHPLELGEEALGRLVGFVVEGFTGMTGDAYVDPWDVPALRYRID